MPLNFYLIYLFIQILNKHIEGINMNVEESLEKIMKRLELIELKIDDISAHLKKIKPNASSSEYEDAPKEDNESFKTPSEVLYEKQEEKSQVSSGSRMKCSKCGSVNVQAVDNKDKIMSVSGGIAIYAKRYYCKKCGNQWD
jgi:hypothetical protein